MSTRRVGKKKAQMKQQTIPSTAQRLQFEAADDADDGGGRPAFASTSRAPTSPAILLAQKALSPVVTAAKAITAAVLSAPPAAAAAAAAGALLPSIPEEGTTATGPTVDVEHEDPSTPRSQPTAAAGEDAVLAAAAAEEDAIGQDSGGHEEEATPATQHLESGVQELEEAAHPAAWAARVGAWLQQHGRRATSCISLRGCCAVHVLLAVAAVVAVAAALMAQGSMLRAQARGMQAQQQQVAHQARVLQQLQQQLQDTSAQLPSLAHAAQSTSHGLSQLSLEHATLHSNLAALSNVTQQLSHSMSRVDATSRQGQHAWQALAAVAATSIQQAGPAGAQPSGGRVANTGIATVPAAAAASNASSPSEWLQQLLLRAQEQLAAQQQLVLQHHLTSQLPPLDLALADCGASILFSTPINASAALMPPGTTSSRSSSSMAHRMASMLRQLQHAHLRGGGSSSPQPAAGTASGLSTRQLNLLLHRVVLRPASHLVSTACVPLSWTPEGAVLEIQLPQPALITSVTLHAPAAAAATTAASPSSSNSGSWQLAAVPGQLTLVLANSSSCGGTAAPCTTLFSGGADAAGSSTQPAGAREPTSDANSQPGVMKPGVAAAVQHASLDSRSYGSGRAVIPMAGTLGAVLADRLVLVVSDAVDGRAAVLQGPCLARVSVQGRPLDPAAFC